MRVKRRTPRRRAEKLHAFAVLPVFRRKRSFFYGGLLIAYIEYASL
jgi:hypothetical protein